MKTYSRSREALKLFFCVFELITFPINLFAFDAPPKLLNLAILILKVHKLYRLLAVNYFERGTVALHTSRERRKQAEVDVELLFHFLQHQVRVPFLGNAVDWHLRRLFAQQFFISG